MAVGNVSRRGWHCKLTRATLSWSDRHRKVKQISICEADRRQERAETFPTDERAMTEARKGSCSNPVRLEEKIEPYQCQSMASEPSTGRMLFRGVDMVFLTVNGHQMLTLHEILEKLFPTTPRSTFCARIEKLNAFRHACTKHETQKIKALGGAKPSAIKCTLIAREHVVEYCEKYNLQNADASQNKSSSEGNVKLCVKNLQGNGKASSIKNQFCTRSDHSAAAVDESVFASQAVLEDTVQCRSNANTENIGNVRDVGETQTETKVLGKENGNSEKRSVRFKKPNIRYSKLSNSGVMSCWSGAAGAISQRQNINQRSQQRAPKPSQVLKKRGTASSSDFVRKLERKRNLELVQTSCGEIVDDNDTVKRQKTSHHLKGNQGSIDAKGGHEESIACDSSLPDFSSSSSVSLTLDLATFSTSTEGSHGQTGQSFQALNDEVFNDVSGQTAKCYLDDDNNNNEIEISHKSLSPTLLLKRSLNNKWRVAKSSLARLNFDINEEVTLNEDDTEKCLDSEETRKEHSTNFTNTSTISNCNDASGLATVQQPSATLTSKVNKRVNVGCFVSTKKNGRIIKGKKSETRIAFKSDEQESNTNQINRFESDIAPAKEKHSGAKFIGNGCSSGVKFAELNRSVSDSNGKSLAGRDAETKAVRLAKDKSNGLQQSKSNKTNGGIVKQKRRRRVQLNTFRLIETIPYPSLLMVKDGDLCPSYTMTYSAAKCLPHCCHPLWRWHLGKPILHAKGSHVGKSSSEPQREESYSIKQRNISISVEND